MKKKVLSYLSLGMLIVGAFLGGYALVKIWLIRASLPAGTCPVITNRPLLYAGIALCLVSFVITLFEKGGRRSRGSKNESGGDNDDAR